MDERENTITQIIGMMNMMLDDQSVPRNIKTAVDTARKRLQEKGDPVIRAGGAIYSLGEASEDINLPTHARTQVWQILSALESITQQQP